MHLGLIGGIGPAATVVYYQRLVERFRAIPQPLELTIVNADVTVLVQNALAQNKREQAAIYAHHIDQLKGAGADIATITSLGGHFCYDETVPLSSLPLISAIEPLDNHFAAQGIRTIGLLGTEQVMSSRLYGQLDVTASVVANQDLDALGQVYLDMATSGHCSDAQRQVFFAAGAEMISQGADAILLAGTDLGLAFDDHNPGFPIIDALDIHVDQLVKLATGAHTLDAAPLVIAPQEH